MEDWAKKCMEFRVEGRGPVGRSRGAWLESVEVHMAELEASELCIFHLLLILWA